MYIYIYIIYYILYILIIIMLYYIFILYILDIYIYIILYPILQWFIVSSSESQELLASTVVWSDSSIPAMLHGFCLGYNWELTGKYLENIWDLPSGYLT